MFASECPDQGTLAGWSHNQESIILSSLLGLPLFLKSSSGHMYPPELDTYIIARPSITSVIQGVTRSTYGLPNFYEWNKNREY